MNVFGVDSGFSSQPGAADNRQPCPLCFTGSNGIGEPTGGMHGKRAVFSCNRCGHSFSADVAISVQPPKNPKSLTQRFCEGDSTVVEV